MQKIVVILFCFFNVAESYANEGASSSTTQVTTEKSFGFGFCQFCQKNLKGRKTLMSHFFTHVREEETGLMGIGKRYPCSKCPLSFEFREHRGWHEKSHEHPEKSKKPKNEFTYRHTDDKERPFGCFWCVNNFKIKSHLQTHVKTQHKVQQPESLELFPAQEPEQFEYLEMPDPEPVPNKGIKLNPEDFLNLDEYED